ncbi:hypothetical protein [Paracoccus zhejiangensis]|uniref:hypothetical protein n=1 Tax=Paracoccus zhejiangensis TaxID=1077935 RepID=UPI00130002B9|nr:hypothetical protein [Paracoccus zhejiangensis]
MIQTVPDHPAWLNLRSDKPGLFRERFDRGELGAAWLTLNGTGWQFTDAAQASEPLAGAPAADERFKQMAAIWIAQATGDQGATEAEQSTMLPAEGWKPPSVCIAAWHVPADATSSNAPTRP